jgi:hypothetical protein
LTPNAAPAIGQCSSRCLHSDRCCNRRQSEMACTVTAGGAAAAEAHESSLDYSRPKQTPNARSLRRRPQACLATALQRHAKTCTARTGHS